MSVATAYLLTKQFYAWERCGRGWHKANYTVGLEPPFYPFVGHSITGDVIDDGKIPSWFDAFKTLFGTPDATAQPAPKAIPLQANPSNDDAPLTIYTVTVPRGLRQSTQAIEQLLVMLSYRKSPISFEIISTTDAIRLQFVCRESDARFMHTQLHAYFPECAFNETDIDSILDILQTGLPVYTVDFGLRDEFMRPLSMSLDHEPLTALFGILSRLQEDAYAIIQVLFSGTHNAWAESIMTAVCDDTGKQSFFFDAPEMPQLAKEKIARPLFGVSIRALTAAPTLQAASTILEHIATALIHASNGGNNALLPLSTVTYTVEERMVDILLRTTRRVGMLLNSKELATFVHMPSIQQVKLLGRNSTTKAVPNELIGHEYILGLNEHHNIETIVTLTPEQRLRHLHLIGATGTGKSTLLHSLIMQDIDQGNGLCVLDPHGDLIDTVIASIPVHRIKDVVLIDPSDSEFPISFNILSTHSDLEKELLASDLVALFKRFSTSWGDQMNSVFANAIMAFVYNTKQYHIGDLRKFLIEQPYRHLILTTVTDADIVYYWQKEFPLLKSTSIGPILTRLDAFLRPRVIRTP